MDWGFFSNSFNTDFKSWKAGFDEARSKKTLKYLLPLAPDCSWLASAFNREPLQEIVSHCRLKRYNCNTCTDLFSKLWHPELKEQKSKLRSVLSYQQCRPAL